MTYKDTITIIGYGGSSKNVVIPEKLNNLPVVAIGESAFAERQLTSVVIPNSVVEIRGQAFWSNKLTSVAIPNSVVKIGNQAFSGNELTSVVIPSNVKLIEEIRK
jgi:hypothetical protein